MNTAKSKIFIYISDIASYIGQNAWDYVEPFERLWKRCDALNYQHVLTNAKLKITNHEIEIAKFKTEKIALEHELKNKHITQRQFDIRLKQIEKNQNEKEKEITQITECIDDINLTQREKLQQTVGTSVLQQLESTNIDTKDKKKTFQDVVGKLDLSSDKIEQIRRHGESYINKTHGTQKEASAIEIFENKMGVKLDTSQQFNKLMLSEVSKTSKYDWYICGKVDGLYINPDNQSENYIVEVKNRMKGFFTSLRDYEKTQIHMYMRMLKIPQSKLVEKYKNNIRITHIFEDQEYTDDIFDYLDLFIKTFEEKFLNNEETKMKYILMSNDQKRVFIERNLYNPIYRLQASKKDNNMDVDSDTCDINSD